RGSGFASTGRPSRRPPCCTTKQRADAGAGGRFHRVSRFDLVRWPPRYLTIVLGPWPRPAHHGGRAGHLRRGPHPRPARGSLAAPAGAGPPPAVGPPVHDDRVPAPGGPGRAAALPVRDAHRPRPPDRGTG